MKNTIKLSLQIAFCMLLFTSCEKEDELLKRKSNSGSISTRATENYSVLEFNGETEVLVGKRYTYTVRLNKGLSKETSVRISSSNRNALRIAWGDSYYPEYNPRIPVNESVITFHVLVIGEGNNLKLHISSNDSNIFFVDNLTIHAKRGTFTINAPSAVLPNTEFEISSICPITKPANTSFGVEWDYPNFQKVRNISNGVNSKYSMILKSTTKLGSQNIKVRYYGQSGAVDKYLIGEATHQIQIANPFDVVFNQSTSSNCRYIFEMPYLSLANGASVTWIASNGLRLVSGQNTGKATFELLNNYQGNTTVSASVIYNNTTSNTTSKEIWVGKPMLTDSGNYNNLIITNREEEICITTPRLEGADKVVWRLLSGKAYTYSTAHGIYIQSKASLDEEDIIRIAAEATNSCGTTSKIYEIRVPYIPIQDRPFPVDFQYLNSTSYIYSVNVDIYEGRDINSSNYVDYFSIDNIRAYSSGLFKTLNLKKGAYTFVFSSNNINTFEITVELGAEGGDFGVVDIQISDGPFFDWANVYSEYTN